MKLRSETMQHGTLVLPADRARDFVEVLGRESHIMIMDMNTQTLVRQYRRYIQRIDEMERILRFLFNEIQKLPGTSVVTADPDAFLTLDHGYQLDRVEEALQKLYEQFERFRDNNRDMMSQKNTAMVVTRGGFVLQMEERAVVRTALSSLMPSGGGGSNLASGVQRLESSLAPYVEPGTSMPSTDDVGNASGVSATLLGFTNVAGVVATSDQEKFARTVFRATRGNAFSYFESITEQTLESQTGKPTPKSVFVIYFQAAASGGSALRDKILRICSAYGISVFDWPRSPAEAKERLAQLEEIISDKGRALEAYEDFFVSESSALLEVHRPGGGSLIEEYRLFCLKEKAIYATLNLFEGAETALRADCWFPEAEEESIRRLLMSHSTPNHVSAFLLTDKNKPKHTPPTYIPTTEFTEVFQLFINTYGVPRYKEVNPALFAVVTFPFLFGIMYGDIGHGICLFLFSLFLLYKWDSIKTSQNEILSMIGSGRYMLLLMSIFSIYAGLMYNDFFSLGLDLFGTRYVSSSSSSAGTMYSLNPDRDIYPFGFDPIWKGASNELSFTNSFKMKLSVIVGGIQMFTGICLKGCNSLYTRDYVEFVFEVIPQIAFLLSLVGLMDFLIIWKWLTPVSGTGEVYNKPLIINNIIDMCLFRESAVSAFSFQPTLQRICIFVMLGSAPLMLLVKPLLLLVENKRKQNHKAEHVKRSSDGEGDDAMMIQHSDVTVMLEDEMEEEEEFDFPEVMIHQVIETIEFCLGVVSNTASYLRLWALSLAHQQLSTTFFRLTIQTVLASTLATVPKGVVLFFIFAVFSGITVAVMLGMDALECLLHSLRLQCVLLGNLTYYLCLLFTGRQLTSWLWCISQLINYATLIHIYVWFVSGCVLGWSSKTNSIKQMDMRSRPSVFELF